MSLSQIDKYTARGTALFLAVASGLVMYEFASSVELVPPGSVNAMLILITCAEAVFFQCGLWLSTCAWGPKRRVLVAILMAPSAIVFLLSLVEGIHRLYSDIPLSLAVFSTYALASAVYLKAYYRIGFESTTSNPILSA